uniref:Uncharacterized protein n=1 Tax=Arundo donax TaxID=35708 RepID=A0A0A9AE62_ARUDO
MKQLLTSNLFSNDWN